MVGLIPLMPSALVPAGIVERGQALGKRFARFMEGMDVDEDRLRQGGFITGKPGRETFQLSVVPPARLGQLLGEMLAEDAFLSPHGLRALSQRHRDAPFKLEMGGLTAQVDYEPGEFDLGAVRGQLELARAGLVPAQLPGDPGAPQLGHLARRPTSPSNTRPAPARSSGCATCRTTSPAA